MKKHLKVSLIAVGIVFSGIKGWANSATLKVCNEGNVGVSFVTVYYDSSIFIRETYKAVGWTNIEPGECNLVYEASGFDGAYLGVLYTDSEGVRGAYRPELSGDKSWLRVLTPSPRFCVTDKAFSNTYESKTGSLTNCDTVGYYPMPFTMYFDPDEGDYQFTIRPNSGDKAIRLPSAKTQAQEDAESEAFELSLVRDHILEYIAAAPSGFESYKVGEPWVDNAGDKVWRAKQPLLAKSCSIVERKSNIYFCTLSPSNSKNDGLAEYSKLLGSVRKSLPQGWTEMPEPPYKDEVMSAVFRASDGLEGEIWLNYDADSGKYNLNYQVVSLAK